MCWCSVVSDRWGWSGNGVGGVVGLVSGGVGVVTMVWWGDRYDQSDGSMAVVG